MIDRSTLKTALAKKQDCLSLQELEQLAPNPSQQHPHLATCSRCQSELAMLKEFEENAPLPGEGAAVAWISSNLERRLDQIKNPGKVKRAASVSTSWFARLLGTGSARWLTPVGALAVIAIASVFVLRPSKQPDLNASLGSGPTIYRSQEVEAVSPAGELAQAPKSLEWKAFAGAAKYKVEVMEVDHALLWSASTNYISLTIPNATQAKMLPGKPVLWQVTAQDSQERTLAVSQVKRFSVSRKSTVSN
jgi:hypothetical protein